MAQHTWEILLDLTTRERERLFNNCNKFIEGQNKEKQRFAPKDVIMYKLTGINHAENLHSFG